MIRTIPVHVDRFTLLSTGHVNAVDVWTELPDGRRQPTGAQATDDETGDLLWTVDCLAADQDRGEVVSVQVRARHMPVLEKFAPVTFRDLEVRVSKGRDGNVRLYWSASGAEPARAGMTPRPTPGSDQAKAA
jgi:hypothetical protein